MNRLNGPWVRLFSVCAAMTLMWCGALSVTSSPARADVRYCGYLVPPFSACSQTSGWGVWSANIASFNGLDQRSVCSKQTMRDGSVFHRVCAIWQAMTNSHGITAPLLGWVGNNSSWTHTIHGEAWSYTGLGASGNAAASAAADLPQRPVAFETLSSEVRADVAALRAATGTKPVSTITRPDDHVTLRATAGKICLSSTAGRFATCGPERQAVAAGLRAVSVCAPGQSLDHIVIYGLVPDGVESVRVTGAAGDVIATGNAVANTFRVEVAKDRVEAGGHIRWSDGTGASTLASLLPEDLGC